MPSLFNIGDIVKCINPDGQTAYLTKNFTYKVLSVSGGVIEIHADHGYNSFFDEEIFELTFSPKIGKFKVNDIVINIDDDATDITIGKPYKVLKITEEDGMIDFLDDVGDRRTRVAEQYDTFDNYVKALSVKVEAAKQDVHRVGDTFSYNNDIYTIIETIVNNIKYYALMCDDGNIWNAFNKELRVPTNFRKL